jgi:hypothetical protein
MNTPELDKQHTIIESGEADTLGRFYDWLHERGYHIAQYMTFEEPEFDGEYQQLVPIREAPEQLFAKFFGIDLNKIEAERRAILDEIRAKTS